ncbi:MAG: ATP-binding protein [Actinomycetota bacterium]
MRSRLRQVSLAGRLMVAFVVLLSLGLAVGTLAMTLVLQVRLLAQVDTQLRSSASILGNAALDEIAAGSRDRTALPSDYYVMVNDPLRRELELVLPSTVEENGRPDLTGYDFSLTSLSDPVATTVPGSDGGPPWRVITIPIFQRFADTPTVVGSMTIGLPLTAVARTVRGFVSWVVLVDALLIVLGALLAWAVVQRSLRPLREIEATAGAIAAGDLSQRIPPGPDTTEVGSLANSLNVMLAKIEHSFAVQRASEERMRRFVSDASHELRTPLATVRGYGELYRIGGIPEGQVPGAMGRIESEARRMSGLVTDLLQLARLDEGRPLSLAPVDLTRLADDAASDLRVLDPARTVTVVGLDGLDGPDARVTTAVADEEKVRQILANLTDNALRHTPVGTPVEIAVGSDEGNAVLEVRDHGPGVPPEDADRIFGRFFRLDTSRSRTSGGSGLGLAIVAAIAAAHGGTTRAGQTPGGGLTIRITLPQSAA